MPTIEEQLLQRNVPGHFSSWADDDESPLAADSGSEGSDAEEEDVMEAARAQGDGLEGDDLVVLQQHRRGFNTGPKGVLADHWAQQRAAHARRRQAEAHREAVLRRIACGVEEEEAAADDEEDDGFLDRYRAQRLQELLQTNTPAKAATNASPASFGALEVARTGIELPRLLNAAQAAGSPAVVLLHAPHALGSRAIHDHLTALAPRHPSTRFLAVGGGVLNAFDAATLPVLIAYDAEGAVTESLPCADEALGKGGRVEREDVVWWLEGSGVVSSQGRAD